MMFVLTRDGKLAINSSCINTIYINENLIGDKVCDFELRCTTSDDNDYILNRVDTEEEAIKILKILIDRL